MWLTINDGVRLSYTDEGEGQPLIIMTGFGGAKEIWAAQIPALVSAGYRVINVDARNQGSSQHTVKGLRISRHGMDLAEVIDQLSLTNVVLLGNSMGAATIFAYLSLFGDANVAAVIDIDQSPRMINDADWQFGFKDVTWNDFPDYFRMPLGSSTYKHIDDDTFALVSAVGKSHPFDAKLNEPFLFDHAAADWRDVIRQLTVPLLIIAGQKSPYFNPDFAAVTAAMAQKGQSVVIPDAGHIVMAEQSDATTKALLAFLKTV
ncbi:alpha/beta fold hydrolase [Furfurilactobacillus siliginis]|uniref:Alpha/beta hydrolase n=1 Tax=Furfurilactobacillus siliginis TaxID=348151 RepID=A0A0R2L6P9_9LACO|nr:alpha/beta hydrolase [Furfurilactobacillus siliginis]KRN94890.1 halo peroxidase [Furfurilactobacillus siliginis]GEK28463.1 alpha/beta hydrolase [Furfurilactobacillus siliginis]